MSTHDFGFLADASPDCLQALRQLTHEYQELVQLSLSVVTGGLAINILISRGYCLIGFLHSSSSSVDNAQATWILTTRRLRLLLG